MTFQKINTTGYLRLREIIGKSPSKAGPGIDALIPVSAATLWRWVREGRFPQPTRAFGSRVTAWSRADVMIFIEQVALPSAESHVLQPSTPLAAGIKLAKGVGRSGVRKSTATSETCKSKAKAAAAAAAAAEVAAEREAYRNKLGHECLAVIRIAGAALDHAARVRESSTGLLDQVGALQQLVTELRTRILSRNGGAP